MGIRDHGVIQLQVSGKMHIVDRDEFGAVEGSERVEDRTMIFTYIAPSPEVAMAHLQRRCRYMGWAEPPEIKVTGTEKIDCMLLEPVW